MKISPLKIDHYFLSDLHFTVNKGFDPTKEPQVKFEHFQVDSLPLQDKQDANKWQVSLRVKYQGDASSNTPYSFTIEIVGLFEVDSSFPADSKEKLAKTNGATILYSVAREMIRGLTSSGPFNGMMMPSVSFVESPAQPKQQPAAVVPV